MFYNFKIKRFVDLTTQLDQVSTQYYKVLSK